VSRVLLTGASGFIGRPTLSALLEAGHEVHALALRRGEEIPGVTWHEVDLLGGCEVLGDVEPEVLVHLAWYVEHGEFWSSPENVRWVEASLSLLRAFAAAGGQRALMMGTCAEYAWSREVYAEDAPLAPATLYGASKHGLHVVASAFAEQAGISLAWVRPFLLYGPFEAQGRFVPSLILPLLRGEPARMTEGSSRRDLLHVSDAGAAIAALAASPISGPVNLASGIGVTLRDVGERIASICGAEELLAVGAIPIRAQEPPSLVADVGRLERELGFSPRISLDDGLRDTVTWWRERSLG